MKWPGRGPLGGMDEKGLAQTPSRTGHARNNIRLSAPISTPNATCFRIALN